MGAETRQHGRDPHLGGYVVIHQQSESGPLLDTLHQPRLGCQSLRHRSALLGARQLEPVCRPRILLQEIPERTLHQEPALTDHPDPGAHALHVLEHVRRHDDGGLAAEGTYELQDLLAADGVEGRSGFVEQEHLGIPHQGLGDAEPLAHPAGVASDLVLAPLAESHGLKQDVGPLGGRPCLQTEDTPDEHQELTRPHPRVETRLLRQETHLAAHRETHRPREHLLPCDEGPPGCG